MCHFIQEADAEYIKKYTPHVMYIFCNIMILFSSFANIINGKFIEGRAKINFYEVRNEKMEK
jgi:hypothetical protein